MKSRERCEKQGRAQRTQHPTLIQPDAGQGSKRVQISTVDYASSVRFPLSYTTTWKANQHKVLPDAFSFTVAIRQCFIFCL